MKVTVKIKNDHNCDMVFNDSIIALVC